MTFQTEADLYLTNQGGSNLVNAGAACKNIAQSIQKDDATASSLLANIFWQAFINSSAFKIVIQSVANRSGVDTSLLNAVLNQPSSTQLDMIIVRHGSGIWPLQDLLIFVHEADQKQNPIGIRDIGSVMLKNNLLPNVLIAGWRKFVNTQSGLRSTIRNNGGNAAVEILQAESFHILIAPFPRIEYTASFGSNDALIVKCENSYCLAAGLYVRRLDGRIGITTALHGIGKSKYLEVPGIKNRFYKPQQGMPKFDYHLPIIDTNKSFITDSYFIEIPPPLNLTRFEEPFDLSSRFDIPLKPMTGVGPAQGARMQFRRVNGYQPISATIIGVDLAIPWNIRAPNQVKVYTDPVTAPGDSGTALIDTSTNTVVGFCFWRMIGPFAAAAWIWSESVFIAHNLIY